MRRHWLSTTAAALVAVAVGCGTAVAAPAVDGTVEVVRKIRQGYLVTPAALIPFTAIIRDDQGLGRVAFVVVAARLEAGKVSKEEPEQRVPVQAFARLLRQRDGQSLKEFRITADDPSAALDLSNLPRPFPGTAPNEPPPRYRLRVWLEATDNGGGPGPHATRSEPVTFVVVSELELISEIANEEELLQLNLEDRGASRLRRAQAKVWEVNRQLATAEPRDLPALRMRADDARGAVELASSAVRDVHADYRRIVRELKVNRVRADMIDRVEKTLCGPLDKALRGEFARSAEALKELSNRLEGTDAGQARTAGVAAGEQLDALVGRIGKAVAASRDLDEVNRLLKKLRDVESLLFERP